MRTLLTIFLLVLPFSAAAQQRDSFFDSYGDYVDFVDNHIINRNFIELIQVLGGRDEYKAGQLQDIEDQMRSTFPNNFVGGALARRVELESGFSQEMRVYWDADLGYNFFYAVLHQRPDGVVVLRFAMNSNIDKILAKF